MPDCLNIKLRRPISAGSSVALSVLAGGWVTTVIVLAMVFVFVALRLWSVLGRRTGHEQTLSQPLEHAPAARASVPVALPGKDAVAAPGQEQANPPAATAGLRAIAAADPKFDVG